MLQGAMDSSESSNDDSIDPEKEVARDFKAEKELILNNLLPRNSRAQYEMAYAAFLKWKDLNKADKIDEYMLLVYFKELSMKWKPSTLWSIWSKLRATIGLRHKINISYFNLFKSF